MFDNRGIGDSDSPVARSSYSTAIMAADAVTVLVGPSGSALHDVGAPGRTSDARFEANACTLALSAPQDHFASLRAALCSYSLQPPIPLLTLTATKHTGFRPAFPFAKHRRPSSIKRTTVTVRNSSWQNRRTGPPRFTARHADFQATGASPPAGKKPWLALLLLSAVQPRLDPVAAAAA